MKGALLFGLITLLLLTYVFYDKNIRVGRIVRNALFGESDAMEHKVVVEDVEADIISRNKIVRKTCRRYRKNILLKIGNFPYKRRLRIDPGHHLMYCENYKIASSTWVTHLLTMNGYNATGKIHSKGLMFSLINQDMKNRKKFKNITSFIVVRDPFERILSAYTVRFMLSETTCTVILFNTVK